MLLGAESSSPKKPAATVSPKGKEGRRGLFRHFSSDAVPASRRTSTNSKSIEFVMECPIESSNCNPDETEHSGGDDNEDPVVKPVSTTPRRKVRRHVSADGIPLYIGGGAGNENHVPAPSSSPRSPRKGSKRGVRRHVSSDGIDIFSSSTSSPRSPHKGSKRGVRRHVSTDGISMPREKASTGKCSSKSFKTLDDDIDNGSYKNFR